MIALILSIFFSSLIMLVFKGFKKYQVHLLTAVVVNYATCTIIGLLYLFANSSLDNIAFNSWMYFAIGIGVLFILVFYGMGYVTEKMGVSTSTVASKMGVVFPVVYGLTFLHEKTTVLLILGILCSILAVYLISSKGEKQEQKKSILPVFLIFFGSGLIDIALKVISDKANLSDELQFLPTLIIFASAFTIGLSLLIRNRIKGKQNIKSKNILAGIALGTPNFFSIYFLLLALNTSGMTASFFYPINNVSVVLLSTIMAIVIFKEQLGKRKFIGLLTAVISILLINFGYAF